MSLIIRLLKDGCPAAILRRVVAIVVAAINGVLRRGPGTHVRKESLKGLRPAFANHDPSSTVMFPAGVMRVPATVFHLLPAAILHSFVSAVLSHCSQPQAATARGVSRPQINPRYGGCLAAIAATFPERISSGVTPCPTENQQHAYAFVGHVNSGAHRVNYSIDYAVVSV